MSFPTANSAERANMTPEQVIVARDAALMRHVAAKKALEDAKAEEMEARKEAFAWTFEKPKEGTNNVELGGGYVAKGVHKVNYKLDNDLAKVDQVCEDIEALGNEGPFLCERIIKWSADISVKEYKDLDDSNPTHRRIKALVDTILTKTDATPTLEIVAPKAAKQG